MQFLNPGQTPVVASDQPLYSLAKQIQWQWPEYGEDKVVMMFGGLHIEMAALKSYLSAAIVEAEWPCGLGAGVVVRRSRVHGLHPVTSGTCFSACFPTSLPPASWNF